jgi:general nucleoside transport system ATP-binding protein
MAGRAEPSSTGPARVSGSAGQSGRPVPTGVPGGVPPRLELRGITKAYPAVVANDGIDLQVRPGEIHAVLGENGAGKSTLMKIIYGVTPPDAGEMLWNGRTITIPSPAHARKLGIAMVFQHFSLFETLTVIENISLAIDRTLTDLSDRIGALSERYGLRVDPRRLVHSLSVGERQRVEIIRCLLQSPQLFILDEPTSVLTPPAVRQLFDTLRQLARDGCSILYISHKLEEIQALCHTATVLRNGKVTGTADPRQEPASTLARMMIGRDLPACQREAPSDRGEERLILDGLTRQSRDPFGTDLHDITLTVRGGEIVGIAGVSGNGQRELLAVLSGEETVAEPAAIRLGGRAAGGLRPDARRALGLCFVPEERLGRGAVPKLSLSLNALLTAHRLGMVKRGLIRFGAARAFADRCISQFQVKCAGSQAEARSLSGGNLQKFIVGREILGAPRLLILGQPTWGVDVGAAQFIRQSLIDLRNAGVAILVISEELEELFEICDRLAVMFQGRLSAAVPTAETNVERIGLWMTGLFPGGPDEGEGSGVQDRRHAVQT